MVIFSSLFGKSKNSTTFAPQLGNEVPLIVLKISNCKSQMARSSIG